MTCWGAGWRDNGDASGTGECPAGQLAREEDDGHRCSGGECAEDECCGEPCSAFGGSCPAGTDLKTDDKCIGWYGGGQIGACTADRCCRPMCSNWAAEGNVCPAGLALSDRRAAISTSSSRHQHVIGM